MRLRDLPASGQRVELWWRKRRLVCREILCPAKTFTQTSTAVRPRARVTERLREQVARAITAATVPSPRSARSTRCRVQRCTRLLIAAAAKWLPTLEADNDDPRVDENPIPLSPLNPPGELAKMPRT